MGTVEDFAQGMLREYRAFAGQCATIAAAPGDEATAAELFAMEDLPLIVEQLRSFRARAEAAEQRAEAAEAALAQAHADLRVMAALGGNIVHKRYMHSPSILSDAVLNEWERAEAASAEVADGDLFAVLRRALGVAS